MSTLTEFEKSDFSQDYRFRALIAKAPAGESVLDIGSGHGEIAEVAKEKYARIILGDHDPELVANLAKKFANRSDVHVQEMDAQHFRLDNPVHVVCMCDILEHLPSPKSAVMNAYAALVPGGTIFISVPAIPWLYGVRDRRYGHLRRYTKKMLCEEIASAGFQITYARYWNILGVIPYLVSEKFFKKALVGPSRAPKGKLSRVVNAFLYAWLRFEHHISWPIGLSLVVIAKKS